MPHPPRPGSPEHYRERIETCLNTGAYDGLERVVDQAMERWPEHPLLIPLYQRAHAVLAGDDPEPALPTVGAGTVDESESRDARGGPDMARQTKRTARELRDVKSRAANDDIPKGEPSSDPRARELAELVRELHAVQIDKSDKNKEFNGRIDKLEAQITQLAEEIATGQGRLFEAAEN